MKNNLLHVATFISVFILSAASHSLSSTHCPTNCPSGASSSNDVIDRQAYIISHNPSRKMADWVAYKVNKSTIGGSKSRNWRSDPNIPSSERLEPSDYTYANAQIGTDRGHQAPLASLSAYSNWSQLNYLSNITPQRSELNQGPWRILEERVRDLAERSYVNNVYVVTGTLYEFFFASLPNANEQHAVPSGYWKVIYWNNGSTTRTAAFIFSQYTPRNANICDYTFTINEVEARAGLNIHPGLWNSTENDPGRLLPYLGC